jgi:Protein of unknown function (DUF3754)
MAVTGPETTPASRTAANRPGQHTQPKNTDTADLARREVAQPAPIARANGSAKPASPRRMWFRRHRKEIEAKLPSNLLKADDAEHFIPVPRNVIVARLTAPELWPPGVADEARRLFRYMGAWRHISYNEMLDRLDQAYDLFSPDSDIQIDQQRLNDEVLTVKADFLAKMRHLLVHANFKEIPREALDTILTRDSEYGLDLQVDFDDYEDIMMFWRGTAERTRKKRRTIMMWKQDEVPYPVYKRLFLLLKMKPKEERIREMMRADGITYKVARRQLNSRRKMLPANSDDDAIFLKMFKDIPLSDMEMMFPNTKVRIRGKDKMMLSLSAGGSIGGVLVGPILKLTAAASVLALSPGALAMLAVALGGVGLRQFNNVMSQRRQYLAVLAQNLYFHTLADNRAAITLLASRAEEEDVKEDMLLYSVLVKERVLRSQLPQVRAAVSNYLKQTFDVHVDFDADEALDRLIQDGLVREASDGRLATLSPKDAIMHLDGLWDGYLDPKGTDRVLIDELP